MKDRIVEDQAGYERTEQNRTGKDSTVEDRAGYERTEQYRTGKDSRRQGMI